MARGRGYWDEWERFPRSTPIRVERGIKARSQRGKFGDTWWANRWIQVLESFGWDSRLQRGRSYARSGQVLEYSIAPGLVRAKVQGSRPKPYDIEIKIKPLSDEEWDKVTQAMAGQAIFAARLLSGEMPQNIEEAFTTTKLTLFPRSARDMDTSCSCPDWANPCKHIAAVYYILGEAFDDDPFMLFQLRGRSREELTEALRKKRSAEIAHEAEDTSEGESPQEIVQPLEECLTNFWVAGEEMGRFRVVVAPPAVSEALLKRLGPLVLRSGRENITGILTERYRTISQQALEMALSEKD